ncbi:Peptidase inhibitor family I36 [Devosia sp. YR412]|uniref:SH3 domain-containing protein n=1 Tax=Devosia sp. YR412 TaxID=1881030 RepID=UPI0008AD1C70|nr:SH3 domain-containing protein [Devosia sp. YR412]SEQ02624.1 Peptidase inhibitor family I36 [Devosia sp. YR412]
MNRRTRKTLLNVATGIAVAATAVVVFLPAAYAAPGTVTSNVNVRSGPGTNYGVVDTVRRGTQVDVQQCEGSWCYIAKPGPDGWISSSYLSAGGGSPVNPQQPGLSFGFSTGPGGPTINFGVGQQPQIQPPRPPRPQPPVVVQPQPTFGEVCFYDRTRFRGESICMDSGESTRNLGDWADRISSIDNPDGLQVQVCSESNYRDCRTYTTSASSLGDFDDYIVSVRVR